MEFNKTKIDGVVIIEPKVFGDERGYFFESFNHKEFQDNINNEVHFVQDNESKSSKGVIRGLHFQAPPFAQGKLVRVIKGSVLDVALDIRKESPTYGEYVSVLLSEENKKQLWIPPGFAHGFSTLEDETIFSYKCTDFYNKDSEGSIAWNDEDLNIDWKVESTIISDKDQLSEKFCNFVSPF